MWLHHVLQLSLLVHIQTIQPETSLVAWFLRIKRRPSQTPIAHMTCYLSALQHHVRVHGQLPFQESQQVCLQITSSTLFCIYCLTMLVDPSIRLQLDLLANALPCAFALHWTS